MAWGLRGQDAWRRHPVFTWGWKQALPGIREGSALFGLYLVYDAIASRKAHGGHEAHGHGAAGAAGHHGDGHGSDGHGAGEKAHH